MIVVRVHAPVIQPIAVGRLRRAFAALRAQIVVVVTRQDGLANVAGSDRLATDEVALRGVVPEVVILGPGDAVVVGVQPSQVDSSDGSIALFP